MIDNICKVITGHKSRPSNFLLTCALENNRRDGLLGLLCKMVPNNMYVCFVNNQSSKPVF